MSAPFEIPVKSEEDIRRQREAEREREANLLRPSAESEALLGQTSLPSAEFSTISERGSEVPSVSEGTVFRRADIPITTEQSFRSTTTTPATILPTTTLPATTLPSTTLPTAGYTTATAAIERDLARSLPSSATTFPSTTLPSTLPTVPLVAPTATTATTKTTTLHTAPAEVPVKAVVQQPYYDREEEKMAVKHERRADDLDARAREAAERFSQQAALSAEHDARVATLRSELDGLRLRRDELRLAAEECDRREALLKGEARDLETRMKELSKEASLEEKAATKASKEATKAQSTAEKLAEKAFDAEQEAAKHRQEVLMYKTDPAKDVIHTTLPATATVPTTTTTTTTTATGPPLEQTGGMVVEPGTEHHKSIGQKVKETLGLAPKTA